MDAGRPIVAEAEATRLAMRLGSRALSEAKYQLSLAEARFQRALAVTSKELSAIDHWAAVSRVLLDEWQSTATGAEASPPPS